MNCAKTSGAVVLFFVMFFIELLLENLMKSRQISGIHFFSILLQLQWLYVISAPFLNSQCSN